MNLTQIRNILLAAILGFSILPVEAQESNTLYFIKNTFAASFLNPAFTPENDFAIGLPFISGINIDFNNNFRINDIVQKGHGLLADTLRFDFNSLYNTMANRGKASFEVGATMFYLGIKGRKNYYSFSVNEKGLFRGQFDKKFIDFFKKGPGPFYGTNADLGGVSFDVVQYREFGFGISRKSSKKVSYGAKLKLLFGRMNMSTQNVHFQAVTSMPDEALLVRPSGSINISGPVKFEADTVEQTSRLKGDLQSSDYFFNFRNLGLAADAGINYQYNKRFNLSASIIDAGFLRFSKKNFILSAENDLEYQGRRLTQASDPNAPHYFTPNETFFAFRDSIPYMTVAHPSDKTQISNLPVKVYASCEYALNRDWIIGFVGKLYFLKNFFYSEETFSARKEFSKRLLLVFSNSFIKNSFINPGIAANYNSKIIQVYLATDNILSVPSPSSLKNLNLQFGINLLIGNE